MQTYLPYPNLGHSVDTYNRPTLMLARQSALNILNILHEVPGAPRADGHPEIVRWKGHEPFLCEYAFVMDERVKSEPAIHQRQRQVYSEKITWHLQCASAGEFTLSPPTWWGDVDFHVAEQSALLRLDPLHYANHFEGVPFDLPPAWMRRG